MADRLIAKPGARPQVVKVTSAQRRHLRWFTPGLVEPATTSSRVMKSRAGLERRGLLRRAGPVYGKLELAHVLTPAGEWVRTLIDAQDAENVSRMRAGKEVRLPSLTMANIADMFGERTYTLPAYLGHEPDPQAIILTGDQPQTCPECGARTSWTDCATPPGRQLHRCLAPECGFPFYADPDAD